MIVTSSEHQSLKVLLGRDVITVGVVIIVFRQRDFVNVWEWRRGSSSCEVNIKLYEVESRRLATNGPGANVFFTLRDIIFGVPIVRIIAYWGPTVYDDYLIRLLKCVACTADSCLPVTLVTKFSSKLHGCNIFMFTEARTRLNFICLVVVKDAYPIVSPTALNFKLDLQPTNLLNFLAAHYCEIATPYLRPL